MRQRRTVLCLIFLTIALGLATRRYPHAFPSFFATYAGDALWAALVYWLLAIVWPQKRPAVLALTALGISFAVEISQRYHAAWIDALRANPVAALVLGRGFLWSDLVCYVAGVLAAAALDVMLVTSSARATRRDRS